MVVVITIIDETIGTSSQHASAAPGTTATAQPATGSRMLVGFVVVVVVVVVVVAVAVRGVS